MNIVKKNTNFKITEGDSRIIITEHHNTNLFEILRIRVERTSTLVERACKKFDIDLLSNERLKLPTGFYAKNKN